MNERIENHATEQNKARNTNDFNGGFGGLCGIETAGQPASEANPETPMIPRKGFGRFALGQA